MEVSPGTSLISHSHREILWLHPVCEPPSLHFVGVAYNLTTPMAPQDMCSGSPIVGENRIKKFQSVPEIQGVQLCTSAVHVANIGPLFEG